MSATALLGLSSAPLAAAPPAGDPPDCLSAAELARYLRVNRKTVYEYAARNVIPCRRLGRRIVFHRAAIIAWLARSPAPARLA